MPVSKRAATDSQAPSPLKGKQMILEIFNVEHGACALITTSNGKPVMIDCGHNSTTGWKPSVELMTRGIWILEKLIVSNYDRDHVSDYPDLMALIDVKVLKRNEQVPASTIRALKSEDGMDRGIAHLCHTIDRYFIGGPATDNDFGDTNFAFFGNTPGTPPFGFNDSNNLSLVTFVTCGDHRFIFPGDMEKGGWRTLIRNPLFVAYLSRVTFFVASHHGRANGYLEEVMNLCPNIRAVIISDDAMAYESQETVDDYRRHATGLHMYDGGVRHVLTTRCDGNIRIDVTPASTLALVKLGSFAFA